MPSITNTDPEVAAIIGAEERRLREDVVLIASENYASRAVLDATGSVLTNKYAEGYPGRRYYSGTENVDAVESLAIARAKQIFPGIDHANVQPHSGSQANMAAYFAFLKPGDRVMSLSLDHGGHLTHGSSVSFSGRLYEFVHYTLDEASETLDYDSIERQVKQLRPRMIISGFTAYPRRVDFGRFRGISNEVGAIHIADISHIAGLVVGGAHESPVGLADVVTTTTHKTLRGPRGAVIMSSAANARRIDSAVFPRMQGGPMGHTIAAKAVAFQEASTGAFRDYARRVVVNASRLAESLEAAGLRIVSGGTDNHLLLVDIRGLGMSGSEAESVLRSAGLVANKNQIPFDPLPPTVASGVRLGTSAITSRGMVAKDMDRIVEFIVEALYAHGDSAALSRLRAKVRAFASGFPVPGLDD